MAVDQGPPYVAKKCSQGHAYGQVSPAGIVNRVIGMEPLA